MAGLGKAWLGRARHGMARQGTEVGGTLKPPLKDKHKNKTPRREEELNNNLLR